MIGRMIYIGRPSHSPLPLRHRPGWRRPITMAANTIQLIELDCVCPTPAIVECCVQGSRAITRSRAVVARQPGAIRRLSSEILSVPTSLIGRLFGSNKLWRCRHRRRGRCLSARWDNWWRRCLRQTMCPVSGGIVMSAVLNVTRPPAHQQLASIDVSSVPITRNHCRISVSCNNDTRCPAEEGGWCGSPEAKQSEAKQSKAKQSECESSVNGWSPTNRRVCVVG
jgi:hypothetical protein